MNKGIGIARIAAAVALVNAAGILLRYFGLDTYLILLGFRFQLSFILPALVILPAAGRYSIKKIFTSPDYRNNFGFVGWIFLPPLLIIGALYLTKMLSVGDPDYFYEFGMSSIIDYPIYLVWNFPMLLLMGVFLIQTGLSSERMPFLTVVLTSILLFAYEFVPLEGDKFDYSGLTVLILFGVIAAFLLKYFQNIYWFGIIFFTVFWSCVLAFGSSSTPLIHMLFAARYQSWDGFFELKGFAANYIVQLQLALTAILISLSAYFRKRKLTITF